jgi:hypothetical protein
LVVLEHDDVADIVIAHRAGRASTVAAAGSVVGSAVMTSLMR